MTDDLGKLIEKRSLPLALRGYDRAATDELLGKVEKSLKAVLAERDELRARAAELDKRASEAREQEQAIVDALVTATRIRSESESEAREAKAGHAREAEAVKVEVRQRAEESVRAAEARAEEIVRAAEARAEGIVEEAQRRARELEESLQGAGRLAEQARDRLRSFLESLLVQVRDPGSEFDSVVDALVARAGDAADDRDEASVPTPAGKDESFSR